MNAEKETERASRLWNLLIDHNIDGAKNPHAPKLRERCANGIARQRKLLAPVETRLADDRGGVAGAVTYNRDAEDRVMLLGRLFARSLRQKKSWRSDTKTGEKKES